jgi:TetR/AcrR family transcriptional regulator, transcriptional repressor for nem operon
MSPATAEGRSATTAKGRATRDRIVDVASSLIFQHGVERSTLDEIGAAAGVGKSQLYHYFNDKAGLVSAVIERQTDQILDAQQPVLSAMDSWNAWRSWRNLIVEVQRQRHCVGGCPIGSLASELSETDEMARVALVTGFRRWDEAIRAGVVAMQEHGSIRADADAASLATATLASLQGGLLLCQTERSVRPLEIALDAAIAHLESWSTDPSS